MTDEVAAYLEKADHALEVAEALTRDGYAPDAASKTYYAMFYAAQAILRSEGIEVIKHSAVGSCLGHHFAKSGKIDPEYHKMLLRARKVREIADYGIEREIVEPAPALTLEDGKAFVRMAREYLGVR